ncbi:hypothetical protein [Natrinema versiforme]|nr:hypothetical protein [Natrinema versiforme]
MADTSDTTEETEPTDQADEADDELVDDLRDGAGCVEIWKHLSERRDDE